MKKQLLLFLLLAIHFAKGQETKELEVTTEVDRATVFATNAQVFRKGVVTVAPGVTTIKFRELSPFIIANSIQAKVNGDVTILSVTHKQEFSDKLQKSEALSGLEAALAAKEHEIALLNAKKASIEEEVEFFTTNRNIGGEEALNLESFRQISAFYSRRMYEMKVDLLETEAKIATQRAAASDLRNEINAMSGTKNYASGSVLVKVESTARKTIDIGLSYVVKNAGWLPSYDLQATDINSPVNLVYKANIRQDTKVDWKDIKIKLSTADPNTSGVKPELKTYYLNYNTPPPIYGDAIKQVSGIVMDEDRVPLPGAAVRVEGTTIGTQTDFEGRYSLAVPGQPTSLVFSYIGFQTVTRAVNSPTINVLMSEDNQALEEVVVVGYGSKAKAGMNASRAEALDAESPAPVPDSPLPVSQVQRQTAVEFDIDIPFSVPSDNTSYSLKIATYKVPADFKYVSLPKAEPSVYLTAGILDWEKFNLLEGEANLFFENTFVGKTILDLRNAADTLQLSLGRDENIAISRKKVTDYSSTKFIGSKKEETRDWMISIKNNKRERVRLEVLDQIPVSTLDEISVEVQEITGADLDKTTGYVKWNLELDPGQTKELRLKYAIKYPRNKRLYIE
jgi:hypothetical protein